MPELQQYSLLERYELQERIAVGGMAEVYRAKAFGAHGFEKELAIKRILPELAQDPEFEQRFIGEAKLAVKLSHANVVQVLDFGRFGGTLFIAMEYVDGLDLAALLKRYRDRAERVPIPAAFQIAVEIARGLDFAHQHGVVHRDVSPSNILLSRAGEVKIADFGIAQAVADVQTSSDRRRIMGKWRYMSPEQTRGEALSTRSDLFSAAAVMYELFTGDKLFGGEEAEDIIGNIDCMEIPKASARRAGLPPRLDDILGRLLQRRIADRPQKSAEVLRELIEVSYESSIVATTLDVADAVAAVIEEPAARSDSRMGVDEIIRQQLGGAVAAERTQRKTAVGGPDDGAPAIGSAETPDADADANDGASAKTGTTMIRSGVDLDGVTLWGDGHTLAAAPGAIRSGRRPTRPPPTEVEPTTGGAAAPRKPIAMWIGTAAVVAGIAIAGTWAARGQNTDHRPRYAPVIEREEREPVAEPPPEVNKATLEIDSVPQGAQVRIDGNLVSGTTPTEIPLDPSIAHRFELLLDGYRRETDEVELGPGERVRQRIVLTALTTTLEVITRPAGATVKLGDTVLGTTPLSRSDVRIGPGQKLLIEKADHHPLEVVVDLEEGKPTVINRRLRSAVTFGSINISVKDESGGRSWADVYLGNKKLGEAPGTIQLPVGRQTLKLVNPETKKTGKLTVTVDTAKVETYAATVR